MSKRSSLPGLLLAVLLSGAVAVLLGSLAAREEPAPELRLPPDLILDDQDSPAAVVFSHTSHVVFTDNDCLACHPQPFSILGRHVPILHEEMDAGGSCGLCHNGDDATDVDDPGSCESCHTGAGPPDDAADGGGS